MLAQGEQLRAAQVTLDQLRLARRHHLRCLLAAQVRDLTSRWNRLVVPGSPARAWAAQARAQPSVNSLPGQDPTPSRRPVQAEAVATLRALVGMA